MRKRGRPRKVGRPKTKHNVRRGTLVKGYIPSISRKFLEIDFFKDKMGELLKGNTGLYVLYENDDLYYVGITSRDLFNRLYQHTKDKHKDNWNKFSVFIIGRGKYLRDVESMAQLISDPPANAWKSRFREHYQYDDKIKKMVKELADFLDEIKHNK
jgi:hypothetical protein